MFARKAICCTFFGLFLVPVSFAQPALEKVLIRAPKPYTNLISAIRARGGRVTREFRYLNAVAAEIPRSALDAVSALAEDGAVTKDAVIPNPAPADTLRGRNLVRAGNENALNFEAVHALSGAQIAALAATPSGY